MPDLPRSFSHSSASTYKQCPRRWKHRYIDKWADPPGPAALIGQFAHDVLEQLCKEPPDFRTLKKAKEFAANIWPKISERSDFKNLKLSEAEQLEFRWKSWHAIEGLWKLEDPSTVEVEATEQRVSTSLSGVPFLGYIDRLDRCEDGLVVTDYKSGNLPKYGNDSLKQVLLYAAAVANKTGEQPTRARLLYLGKKIIETEVSDLEISEVTKDLYDTWESLRINCENNEFKAVTTQLCGWCSFVSQCPEGEKYVKKQVRAGRMKAEAPARIKLGI
tara:strand:- start:330 stop:1151 length:822 start_codon:yes stop_codon:yes gene_type:complete